MLARALTLACVPACSKLINYAVPDTIDERALNFPAPGKELNAWEKKENQNVAINSARSIGCQVRARRRAARWRGP